MDTVQSRYGWTDQEVLSLPYARLMDLFKTIQKKLYEEQVESYKQSAYIAYLMGAGGEGVTFNDYVESLGLNSSYEEVIEPPKQHTDNKGEAISKANDVLRSFNASGKFTTQD